MAEREGLGWLRQVLRTDLRSPHLRCAPSNPLLGFDPSLSLSPLRGATFFASQKMAEREGLEGQFTSRLM